MAGHRQVDQSVDERRVGQSGPLPESGIHRDWGEPRDGVHFVENGSPVGIEEEVDPGHAGTAQGDEGPGGQFLELDRGLRVQVGFVDQLGAVVLVLPCVVVEVPARPDLAGPRHLGDQVAQDGQFDLPTIDCPLDDQSLVVASRCFQRHFEGRRVVGP